MNLAVKPFKAIGSWLKSLTLSEKIIFSVCLFVMASIVIYIFAGVPAKITSDSASHSLLAEEIVYTKQLIPSDWNSRNDVAFFGMHMIISVLTLFCDNQVLMLSVAGLIMFILTVLSIVYCSRVVSKNNCWIIFIPMLMCGISEDFDRILYDQFSYLPELLFIFLTVSLFIDSIDENYKIRSKIKFILSLVLIVLLGVAGIRRIQSIDLPLICAIVFTFCYSNFNTKISDTIKSKVFLSMSSKLLMVITAVALGFIGFKIACSVHNFLPSHNNSSFTTDFLASLNNFYTYFVKLLGLTPGVSIFSADGIINLVKSFIGIMMLIVFPVLQLRKYKSETPEMRLFTVFALAHALEILVLALLCNTLGATRYLYTSMFLLYYLSAHYIAKNMLTKDTSLKNVLVILCVAGFAVPLTIPKTLSFIGAEEAYSSTCALVDHLEEKGLQYGYGTTWNSTVNTIRSNFKVQVNKAQLSPVAPIRSNNTDRAYLEKTYQGKSFVLLGNNQERKTFLESESYVLFGEPAEVDTFENYYIYIYDYNIANNDFGGLAGGFSGIEFNQLFTMKNEYNAEGIIKYTKEDGYELISSHTAYGLAEDNDSIMIISAEESLPLEIAGNAEAKGTFNEYKVYLTNKQTISLIKNPNYIINSDFTSPLGEEWHIEHGEQAELTDKGVKITCVDSSGRSFVQSVNIPTDLIGKTVTLSISVLDFSGDVGIQIVDGYTGDVYVKQNLERDNCVYSFSFVAKSNVISVSPAVPKNVGSYAVIENVKLEKGGVPTAFTQSSEQIFNENLIENPGFKTDDIEEWTIGSGESIEYFDDSVKITCKDSVDRVFQQIVNIDESLLGQPVTFTVSISEYNGEVITRIADSDNTDMVYVRQVLQQSGNVVFTFIPEDNDICIQPAVPKNVGDNVIINWVKLEAGAASTPYVSEVA